MTIRGDARGASSVRERPYFSPESVVRRVWREVVVLPGGGQRMLLMEAAHPLVAAAIVDHSSFHAHPWQRLVRTISAYSTAIFGTEAEAHEIGKRVRAGHARVSGSLRARAGKYERGRRYSACDPELLLWVHATAVDTALLMYSTFVGRLSEEERESFYEEMKRVAFLFGRVDDVVPPTLADFFAYERKLLSGSDLVVAEPAREVARLVLRPPAPLAFRPALDALKALTIGLLPAAIRERYGFRWYARDDALLRAFSVAVRTTLPLVPRSLRFTPLEVGAGAPAAVVRLLTRV